MGTAAEIVSEVIDSREFRLRASLRSLFSKMQREFEPSESLREFGGVPADMLESWIDRYQRWYMSKDDFWRAIYDKAVSRMDVVIPRKIGRLHHKKASVNEVYTDLINERSEELATILANTDTETVKEVLRLYQGTSWTRVKRELKRCIGLQPRQVIAQYRYAAWARANLPPEKAERAIARAYNRRLNYRAGLIAKTEMGDAISDAQLRVALLRRDSGDYPANMRKVWRTRGFRVCPTCMQNEDVEIPLDGVFPSGHTRPLAHPDCRCGLQFISRPGVRVGRGRYDQRRPPEVEAPAPVSLGKMANDAWVENQTRITAKNVLLSKTAINARPVVEHVIEDYPTPVLERLSLHLKTIDKVQLRATWGVIYHSEKRHIRLNKSLTEGAESVLRHGIAHAIDAIYRYSHGQYGRNIPRSGGMQQYSLRVTLDKLWQEQRGNLPEGYVWNLLTAGEMRRYLGRPGLSGLAYKDPGEFFAEALRLYREKPLFLKLYYPDLHSRIRNAIFYGREYDVAYGLES